MKFCPQQRKSQEHKLRYDEIIVINWTQLAMLSGVAVFAFFSVRNALAQSVAEKNGS